MCIVPKIGRGIKVTKSFKRKEVLLRYFGELVTEAEAKRRENAGPKVGHFYRYKFQVKDRKYILDSTREDGSFGRLVNHSRKHPNVVAKPVDINGEPGIILVAKQDLEIGTELRYDYGERDKAVLEANPWLKK